MQEGELPGGEDAHPKAELRGHKRICWRATVDSIPQGCSSPSSTLESPGKLLRQIGAECRAAPGGQQRLCSSLPPNVSGIEPNKCLLKCLNEMGREKKVNLYRLYLPYFQPSYRHLAAPSKDAGSKGVTAGVTSRTPLHGFSKALLRQSLRTNASMEM